MSAGPESGFSASLDDFYPGFLWEMAELCSAARVEIAVPPFFTEQNS